MNGNIVKNKIFLALIANAIPIIGVLFWQWSAMIILLAYWLENFVIGWFVILKMRRAKRNFPVNEHNKLVPGPLRLVSKIEHTVVPIIFVIHYSAFMLGHFIFLKSIAGFANEPLVFNYGILITILPLLYTYYLEYRDRYVVPKAYELLPLTKLMFSPYRRIIVMHLTIIFGSFAIMWGAKYFPPITIVLVLLKIVLDVTLKDKDTEFWKEFNGVVKGQIK